jgi:hypothetical protein
MIEWVPEGQRVNHRALPGGPGQAPKTIEKEKSAILGQEVTDSACRQCASSAP